MPAPDGAGRRAARSCATTLPAELGGGARPAPAARLVARLASWAQARLASRWPPLLDDAMPEFERTLIREALKVTQGERQEAAKLLGWGRNTLTRKLKELGMEEPKRCRYCLL